MIIQNVKKKIEEDAFLIGTTLDLPRALQDLATPAYVTDHEGRVRWVNTAYIQLLGDLRGRPFVDAIAPEHRPLARTNFARKVVGKASTMFDVRVLDRRGNRLTMRVTSAPLRQADAVVGVFGIAVPLDGGSIGGDGRDSVLADLTPRQLEVLRLLSEGLETHQIAERLGIAEETARNHIRALLRAIGVHSRLEAVLTGLRSGLLDAHLTQPGQSGSDEPADQ